jgi:alpha-ribazole phosphatase
LAAFGRHELLLIRHAPALHGGALAGRRDVPADLGDGAGLAALRRALGPVDRVIASPALRCRQTATALWSGQEAALDARLWEQDFGAWEGMRFADLPDLGPLSGADLAAHRPPGGESFADLCARVEPALRAIAALPGRSAILAHAGTVRAGLAMALGMVGPALGFAIDPLSVTRLTVAGDGWAIGCVNHRAAP